MTGLSIGSPVECADLDGVEPCRGVRECGTSELARCTCGLRRALGYLADGPRRSRPAAAVALEEAVRTMREEWIMQYGG